MYPTKSLEFVTPANITSTYVGLPRFDGGLEWAPPPEIESLPPEIDAFPIQSMEFPPPMEPLPPKVVKAPPLEPLYARTTSCHYGVRVENGMYIAEYKCDGKKRMVTESKDYDTALKALREDVKKMREIGKKASKLIGTPKRMISKHYGIVWRDHEGVYVAEYKCNGQKRFVGKGTDYDRLLRQLKTDVKQMKLLGAKIFHNIGLEKHAKRFLEPAKHVGISISARSQMYVAQMSVRGKNRVIASGRDYDEVLRQLQAEAEKQKALGNKINPKVGKLKFRSNADTRVESKMRRLKIPLEPSMHWGVTRVTTEGTYKGVYNCDGKPRYVGQGRNYQKIVKLVQEDAAKMRAAGRSISKRAGFLKFMALPIYSSDEYTMVE